MGDLRYESLGDPRHESRNDIDPRAYFVAGYLSAEPEFRDRTAQSMLPLARRLVELTDEVSRG